MFEFLKQRKDENKDDHDDGTDKEFHYLGGTRGNVGNDLR